MVSLIRFFARFFCLLPLTLFAANFGFIRFFDSSNSYVVWCGQTLDQAVQDLNVDWRAQDYWYSYVMQSILIRRDLYVDIGDNDPADVGARLRSYFDPDDPYAYAPIDWAGDWTGNLSPLKPLGSLVFSDGQPAAIVANNGQAIVAVPLLSDGSGGYTASGVYVDGRLGSYGVSNNPDLGWVVGFSPAWSGGVSNNGTSSSLSGGTSSSSVVLVGGGSSQPSSGATVFDDPSLRPVVNNDGDTYYVVDAPVHTATLPNGDTIVMRDYTSILNALGLDLSSGFGKLHDDLSVVNDNLLKQLEIDSVVDVAEDSEPFVNDDAVVDDVQSQLDLVSDSSSGWHFDFGMGSNPIGNVITSMIGNPPTSFGSQDNVCNVDFELPLVGTIHYSFVLSDWFPSAFRSCVLMILSIFFAIACAKAVSGAFQ